MSVRWILLAVLAVIVAITWILLARESKAMSAAERDLNDRLRAMADAADKEVSRRPRVRAGTLPTVTPTTKGTK